jgi:hypothetical protein
MPLPSEYGLLELPTILYLLIDGNELSMFCCRLRTCEAHDIGAMEVVWSIPNPELS